MITRRPTFGIRRLAFGLRVLPFGIWPLALTLTLTACSRAPHRTLRVCADPNNLPYSNEARHGFENQIADLLARDRHAALEYTWWAQRRGFVRNTLAAGSCDIVMGVPEHFDPVRTTKPYYTSTYVFATRQDRRMQLGSLDDPRLKSLRIGVQMIGDDFTNTPPAHALSDRGIVRNVVGYSVFGDYAKPNPLAGIMDAVDRGEVDTAVVWGPPAGYFARHASHPIEITPVTPRLDGSARPFVFAIAMGVRRGDVALASELDDFIARRKSDIDRILAEYGVPRVEGD
jgi:mxaJ protein